MKTTNIALMVLFLAAGCAGLPYEVTDATVSPGTVITWLGEKATLLGDARLVTGAPLPDATLTDTQMHPSRVLDAPKVRVIDTIPSIDTPVCEAQTHLLGEYRKLLPGIERITISQDLPYALRRFGETMDYRNVRFLSDYRDKSFARAAGLEISRNGLLARAVLVVDEKGIVRHLQIVPEITQMPDMEKAFRVANDLVKAGAR